VVEQLIEAAKLGKNDRVLEIGTGTGFLTRRVVPLVADVISYEVDPSLLANPDAGDLEHFANLERRLEDPFEKNAKTPQFDVCLSSLPYSRSRDFVEWLSKLPFRFRTAAIIVQDEFAEKLVAGPGDEKYRAISVVAQISFRVELGLAVEKNAFRPPPKVTSRIVTLEPKIEFPFFDHARLEKLHQLFSRRRKLVSSELRKFSKIPGKEFEGKRIESLRPQEFAAILKSME
jgi:16S rRNA (adenine1518-N6/adenine1519-N6)-dimethyltransferase